MTPAQSKERYIWLATGVVLAVWASAWVAHLAGILPTSMPYDINQEGIGYTLVVVVLVLAGIGLGWLTYYVGVAQGRKQRLVERHYRIAMEEVYRGTLTALASALENRDNETHAHSRRVMGYSLAIARRMGLDQRQLKVLSWGALLHDLGKIGVPDQILGKPGPLTPEERAQMNQHVLIGSRMAQHVPFLMQAATVIRYHHERYDGQGYLEGLAGEEIPLVARIFSVADAFDAMTSSRPYRPVPLSFAAARQVILAEAGAQFCPRAATVFAAIPLAELERIRDDAALPVSDFNSFATVDDDLELATADYYHDQLSGVKNQSAWELKQTELAETAGRALGTVVYIALKGLGELIDPRSHLTEERVLRDLGTRLYQVVPEGYRVGSAEFILRFPPDAWSAAVEQELRDLLERFVEFWRGAAPALTVRWSTSTADDATASVRELVRAAANQSLTAHK